jgi:cystatin-C
LCVLVVSFAGYAESELSRKALPGGYSSVSTTDEEVVAAARFAVDEQTKREAGNLQLVAIRSSEQQVVAGINYRLVLVVKRGTKEQTAEATVYRDLKSRLSLTAWDWVAEKP